jgi:hypothetical protein
LIALAALMSRVGARALAERLLQRCNAKLDKMSYIVLQGTGDDRFIFQQGSEAILGAR